jgi:uncharacterized membrane protein YphA (DoxX/SURF4 family)
VSTTPAEKPRRSWKYLALAARIVVGGLFIISAIGKIIDPDGFAGEVRDYQILPIVATNVVAYILPWIELLAGSLLVATLWRREARLIIAVLLVVFTVAKTWTYTQGIDIQGCGCSGGVQVLDYIYDTPQGILTNMILLALLAVDRRAQRLAQRAARPPVPEQV